MVGLFLAGVVLLDPPLLNLVGGVLFGWPVLYVYFFSIWALLIVGMALASERGQPEERAREAPRR